MNFNLGHSVARPLLVLLHLISAVVVARNHDDVPTSVPPSVSHNIVDRILLYGLIIPLKGISS